METTEKMEKEREAEKADTDNLIDEAKGLPKGDCQTCE
jgi:hypothetical protein